MKAEIIEQIKEDIIRHEGYVAEVYLCSEGHPTFGVGHLITEDDPEHSWPVGTPVEKERIESVFNADLQICIDDALTLVPSLEDHPDNVQRVIVNMAFNIGRPRLSQFKNMLKAVEAKDYGKAADEMIDSRWYGQVGRRSKELVELMRG